MRKANHYILKQIYIIVEGNSSEGGVKMGNESPEEDKTISINIPMSMHKWLSNEGKDINRSELFRQAVNFKMKGRTEKVPSVVFLASIMGIVFSISLLGIAITPSPINVYMRAIMALLAGVLSISTSFVYMRERRKLVKVD